MEAPLRQVLPLFSIALIYGTRVKWMGLAWLALLIATFATPAAAEVQTDQPVFLTQAEARKAILDESVEAYFTRLQPMEMAAKTGRPIGGTLAEQRAETRRRYLHGVLNFTEAEKHVLRWYVSSFQPLLKNAFPALAQSPWRFIKVKDSIEGGLPHTRGSHIILSEFVLSQLLRTKDQDPELTALIGGGSILIHELVHVHQRREPQRYADLYQNEWGFVKADHITSNAWLRKHQAINPDGIDLSWIFPIREDGKLR